MKTKHAKSLDNTGFSLVELIVVIAIMAILAAVAIPTFAHFITKANETADIQFMNNLEHMIMLEHATDANAVITEIEVIIGEYTEQIVQIKYTVEIPHPGTATVVIEKDFQADDQSDSGLPIDWSYRFKARDSVKDNPSWRSHWRISELANH